MAADAYAKAYGPSDRRMMEASKRAKAMVDKLGGPGGVDKSGGSGMAASKSASSSARGARMGSAGSSAAKR